MFTTTLCTPGGRVTLYWQAGHLYATREDGEPWYVMACPTPSPLSLTTDPATGAWYLLRYDLTSPSGLRLYTSTDGGLTWTA